MLLERMSCYKLSFIQGSLFAFKNLAEIKSEALEYLYIQRSQKKIYAPNCKI